VKKLIIFLLLTLCLAINPAACEAGYVCADSGGDQAEFTLKDAPGDKQDGSKPANIHHCFCSHASTQPLEPAAPAPGSQPASRGIFTKEESLGSVVVGPPLQPPSLA